MTFCDETLGGKCKFNDFGQIDSLKLDKFVTMLATLADFLTYSIGWCLAIFFTAHLLEAGKETWRNLGQLLAVIYLFSVVELCD